MAIRNGIFLYFKMERVYRMFKKIIFLGCVLVGISAPICSMELALVKVQPLVNGCLNVNKHTHSEEAKKTVRDWLNQDRTRSDVELVRDYREAICKVSNDASDVLDRRDDLCKLYCERMLGLQRKKQEITSNAFPNFGKHYGVTKILKKTLYRGLLPWHRNYDVYSFDENNPQSSKTTIQEETFVNKAIKFANQTIKAAVGPAVIISCFATWQLWKSGKLFN